MLGFVEGTRFLVDAFTMERRSLVLWSRAMLESSLLDFIDPKTGEALRVEDDALVGDGGHRYPIVDGIPRFVGSDNYAAAFGLEWTLHSKTQLDSHTGTTITADRLERALGRKLSSLAGLRVLEAGCGAGRFTEVLVAAGAFVHSIDLSVAVAANRSNIGERSNYRVAQADLRYPPFAKKSFDIVLCLGVLQHTPTPEESVRALWGMVKPGGSLVIDHYTWSVSLVTKLAPLYRFVLLRMTPERAKLATDALTRTFFPLHWRVRSIRPAQMLLSRISPCLVYFNMFPELTYDQHFEFTRLDTFDHLTDRYKHLRTRAQIEHILTELGGEHVTSVYAGNGVEGRATKPS